MKLFIGEVDKRRAQDCIGLDIIEDVKNERRFVILAIRSFIPSWKFDIVSEKHMMLRLDVNAVLTSTYRTILVISNSCNVSFTTTGAACLMKVLSVKTNESSIGITPSIFLFPSVKPYQM